MRRIGTVTMATIGAGIAAIAPLADAGDDPPGPAERLERAMLADFAAPAVASAASVAASAVHPSRAGTVTLATGAGRLTATAAAASELTTASTRGEAAVFAGASGRDLGVRSTPLGFRSYVQFRNPSSRSFAWNLSLPGKERLVRLADGTVGVLARRGGVAAHALPRGWRLVATISAPSARDAHGRRIASAVARGARDRLVLRLRGAGSGPVVARMSWAPVGDLGNGWRSHGAERPLDDTTWTVQRGKRTRAGGCAYVERGTLAPGVVEEARDVASSTRGCRVVVETGRLASDASGHRSVAHAAATHRNKAYHKSIQEDPVQIDVNSVKDIVDWRWNRRCTRALKMYDRTDAYGPTGWELVERHPLKHRNCDEQTMQTYAKFKGGEFFPACFGSQVTTIYANNIVQGFPDGHGGYHVYRVTGGPPCHELLHWDRKRGNKRIY